MTHNFRNGSIASARPSRSTAPQPCDATAEPYASRPLHATADGIRIVTIDPDLNSNGLLVCRLQTTTFAQRPQYETLSYRWGDESLKKKIIVDDVGFDVTNNLYDALHYFRQHRRKAAIWIDAISINQNDIPERSSQLRIMPHIYARASSTLVWLGGRYIHLPIHLGPGAPEAAPHADIKDRIVSDGYWDRVWILQEIGKARKIHLCFGKEPAEWDDFIAWIRKHEGVDEDIGPLRLDRLRRDKYDGSCSLRQLLVNHANALSKDPRDKIYGLVGLSTDGRGFPMDYNKTLLQVWSDTIHFMSRHDLLPEDCSERVQFCRTVRDLLGGEELGSVSGVVRLYNNPDEESFLDDHNLKESDEMALSGLSFFAEVYGVIVSLGPSASELLSSLETTDAWEEELQRMYRGNLDSAHYENDSLMRRIFDASDGKKIVTMSTFRNYRIGFHGPEMYGHYWNFMHKERRMAPGLENAWVHETSTPDEPRLAMIKISHNPWDSTPFKLAFVSPDVQQGDFICRIDGYPMKRVVVRPAEEMQSNNVRMHVCGTAITVKDVLADTYFNDEHVEMSYKLDVVMDARTLYALIFGNEDEEELRTKLGNIDI
ncbi:hypothetical protein QQS21_000081 [Conoideocrella luteorostrata]|uniref:Heterokaryon incompatibility domain-containing protein n=1 Tax=Conoideocrella luteorostrata TaxID=1105319 RepID=A0AAJ0D1J2_9HYPO|nr:hypothetical protein QQS21_000081 [Conoideocrella luteorostrata]